MKKLSDSELEGELKYFRQSQKERNSRVFGKDLKNFLLNGPVKESGGARKKGMIVNRSASTNQLHAQQKNQVKGVQFHRQQINESKDRKIERPNQKRIQTQIPQNFTFNTIKTKNIEKEHQIPIERIKQYLKSKAPKAPSQINQDIHISMNMRKLVICWIIELTHALKFRPETLFHTIYLFDRMLEMKISEFTTTDVQTNPQKIDISIENLQLLAIACILISSKYEEITPPPLRKFLQFSQHFYSKRKLISMQSKILQQNNFNLTFPTRYTFVSGYLDIYECYSKQKKIRLSHMCHYLCTISLLELWEDTSEDEIAEAIFFLSKKVLGCQQQQKRRESKKLYTTAWKLKQIWNNNYGGIISYIFDSDRFSFVGGVYLKQN